MKILNRFRIRILKFCIFQGQNNNFGDFKESLFSTNWWSVNYLQLTPMHRHFCPIKHSLNNQTPYACILWGYSIIYSLCKSFVSIAYKKPSAYLSFPCHITVAITLEASDIISFSTDAFRAQEKCECWTRSRKRNSFGLLLTL